MPRAQDGILPRIKNGIFPRVKDAILPRVKDGILPYVMNGIDSHVLRMPSCHVLCILCLVCHSVTSYDYYSVFYFLLPAKTLYTNLVMYCRTVERYI